jgi:hypothetical protein
MRPRKKAASRHQPSLQRFALEDLAPFTKEGTFSRSASRDFHLFYVGRDDVHGILKYLLSRATSSLYLNMFGYDDEELNAECMRCAVDRSITTVITLDKSQAGGVHERAILEADLHRHPRAFNTHVVIGQSATHQISHTKASRCHVGLCRRCPAPAWPISRSLAGSSRRFVGRTPGEGRRCPLSGRWFESSSRS